MYAQNPKDRREILCDAKLKAVMGGNEKVTMFSMNKHITPHLLEKLDKSYYTHEEEDGVGSKDDDSDEGSDDSNEL
jgi:upstream activation factor subunit UAF30